MIHASYNRTMRRDVCVGCPRVARGQNVEQGGVHLFVNSGTRNPKATIAPLFYNFHKPNIAPIFLLHKVLTVLSTDSCA
jgi:hypothetical protein